MVNGSTEKSKEYFQTDLGKVILGDSREYLDNLPEKSVDLVMTSPPFGLVRKKEYGNVDAGEYCEWFRPFGEKIYKVLKDEGSFVLDLGGAWNSGFPTKHLYQFKLLVMLCEELKFYLAQDFYWWNPSKLPTPAEWVTVRRIRVKDAINCVWWLSKTPWPKASNKKVLQPYSDSMKTLLKSGYKAMKRPSGHDISEKFSIDNGASIPPNLIAIPNTESNSSYIRYCKEQGLKVHPARYPSILPEYFIRMLTNRGDFIVDPFAGSLVTGEVAERLKRKWSCVELSEEYIKGGLHRFEPQDLFGERVNTKPNKEMPSYRLAHPSSMWNGKEEPISIDGGKSFKRKPHISALKEKPKKYRKKSR